MERARRDAQPKIPLTMLEYAGCFNNERYSCMFQTYNGQNMYRGYMAVQMVVKLLYLFCQH